MALDHRIIYPDEHHIDSKWVIYGVRLVGQHIRYVGMTTQGPVRRFYYNHLQDAYVNNKNTAFYKWMRKYQPEDFEVVILSVCFEDDYESLMNLETYWIHHYREIHGSLSDRKTKGYVLNQTDGGLGVSAFGEDHWNYGRTRPQETRDKISKTRKERGITVWNSGKKMPQYEGEGNPFYGQSHTDETRLKMSKSSHNRWHTSRGVVKDSCAWCS